MPAFCLTHRIPCLGLFLFPPRLHDDSPKVAVRSLFGARPALCPKLGSSDGSRCYLKLRCARSLAPYYPAGINTKPSQVLSSASRECEGR
eukprot:scaffold130537_cov39-Prasinocladus_malaysianus.AAC.2